MAKTILQIFLYLQVFVIGLLVAVIYRHAREHYKQSPTEAETEANVPLPGDTKLPEEVRKRMLQNSELKFQSILNASTLQLQGDLAATTTQINQLISKMANEIVQSELARYHEQLTQLHKQAETDMATIKSGITQHETEIKAQITKEVEAEKAKMLKQIDTKLGDAVSSFLVEALGHNVDLGSQTQYLVSLLESHKADFKKEITDDAPTA